MNNMTVDKSIDCKGLACPMPIVRTKKAMDEMKSGEVLEVVATDPGSVADVRSWADRTGHQFLGTIDENGVYKHYIRKSDPSETRPEQTYPHVVSNEELEQKLDENPIILDVREPMEYAFGHIPGAKLVPFGKLEEMIDELLPYQNQEIYVICRAGNRSDAACQVLQQKGFTNVKNVVPGMSGWKGPVETQS
jgi:rhodanese-related sulfurtransferase/TusA-related sulfurtransferase